MERCVYKFRCDKCEHYYVSYYTVKNCPYCQTENEAYGDEGYYDEESEREEDEIW